MKKICFFSIIFSLLIFLQGCYVVAELTHTGCRTIDVGDITNLGYRDARFPNFPTVPIGTNASYKWSTGQTTSELINVNPGKYRVTVTDYTLNSIYNNLDYFNLLRKVDWVFYNGLSIQNESIFTVCTPVPSLPGCLSLNNPYAVSSNYLKNNITNAEIEFKLKNNISNNYNLIIGLYEDNSSNVGTNNFFLRFISTNSSKILEFYKNNTKINFLNGNSSIVYDVSNYFTIKKELGKINIYVNGSSTPIASVPASNVDLFIKGYFNGIGAGFEYVRTTIDCPPPPLTPISNNYYVSLEKSLNDTYYSIDGNTLYFKFNEEYKPNSSNQLSYLIYEYNNYSSPSQVTSYVKQHGDNRLALDFSSQLPSITIPPRELHILEVRNEKNEKWFLKFYKKN